MIIFSITRRGLLGCAAALLLPFPASAQPQPWQAAFVIGGFDGKTYVGGLHVVLQPHWKTYWRVPGSGGIPPTVSLTGNNIKSFTLQLPLPQRFKGEDGETVGYKDEVLFPFVVEPVDAALPISVNASAFIGVCDTICIPVPIEQNLSFMPTSASTPDAVLVKQWQFKVPRQTATPIALSAKLENQSLVLSLEKTVDDIFIEGPDLIGFSAPRFDRATSKAHLQVIGLKSPNQLIGQTLRLTITSNGEGLEQMITVV